MTCPGGFCVLLILVCFFEKKSMTQKNENNQDTYSISGHARAQFIARWPATILGLTPPSSFVVPRDAEILGYVGIGRYVVIPDTPMAGIAVGSTIVTVLTREEAEANLALRGEQADDFSPPDEQQRGAA
ncbi:MAG TPA: hypothetical protein VGM03_17175 [Phycisphaerae bacterium]